MSERTFDKSRRAPSSRLDSGCQKDVKRKMPRTS